MRGWRPNGWDNPYQADWDIAKNMLPDALTFEAGADAILGALRDEEYGWHYDDVYGDLVVQDKSIQGKSGWLIFIPDKGGE